MTVVRSAATPTAEDNLGPIAQCPLRGQFVHAADHFGARLS
jgi:hypothetical protein